MTYDEFRKFAEGERWTFAKTMKTCPHEYIIRGKTVQGDALMTEAIRFCHEKGFKAYYNRDRKTYFAFEGYFYWDGDENPEYSICLNRCRCEDYKVSMQTEPELKRRIKEEGYDIQRFYGIR